MHRAFYLDKAAACVRGMLGGLPPGLDDAALLEHGRRAGLELHTFKRSQVMPRVRAAISAVKSLAPESLLDIGSGRGAFLWPLLDEMPWLPVTALDADTGKAALLAAVGRGAGGPGANGEPCFSLAALQGDATALPFADGAFDMVSVLEVLEHLTEPIAAASEALRVAGRAVIATVPSRPDDNPEHIRLFTRESLAALFLEAGAGRIKMEEVQGSFLCIALR